MDRDRLVARVRAILLTPKTEWPVIAAEPDSVGGLYSRYIVWLAAIPALAGFIKMSILGVGVPFLGTVRVGFGTGLMHMLLQYALALGVVYLLALLVEALAPTFGGQKDRVQALKTAAYASTASWVAGVFVIVPWIGSLLALAGGLYAIYLLYLGLPHTMRCADDKAVPYTAVTILAAIVLTFVLGSVIGRMTGVADLGSRGSTSIEISRGGEKITIDTDRIEKWAQQMEAAGKKMEEAEKSGDSEAGAQALGQMMGTLFGGGEGEQVVALAPEQLKPFLPETLGALKRNTYSAKRSTVFGLQIAEAEARYASEDGDRQLTLEITDMGGAQALAALAGWAVQEVESQSDSGYERVYRESNRTVREEWNAQNRSGSYTVLLARRFTVTLNGQGIDMDELKRHARALDLAKLEAMRATGGKS